VMNSNFLFDNFLYFLVESKHCLCCKIRDIRVSFSLRLIISLLGKVKILIEASKVSVFMASCSQSQVVNEIRVKFDSRVNLT